MRRWLPWRRTGVLGHLTPTMVMTDKLPDVTSRRSIELETSQADALEELERLRIEVEELRAARLRLVLAADADRRALERVLHDGVHQHLVALAVTVQLARQAVDADPAAAKALLDELSRDLDQALQETALLAQRIYPATFDADRLAMLLRAAAVNAHVRATVDVTSGSSLAPEVGMTVYLCWLDTLARADGARHVSIRVREDEGALAFELIGAARSDPGLERMRDRVEALGGQLVIDSASDGGLRLTGSLPLAR